MITVRVVNIDWTFPGTAVTEETHFEPPYRIFATTGWSLAHATVTTTWPATAPKLLE